jgi:hypothetical protein
VSEEEVHFMLHVYLKRTAAEFFKLLKGMYGKGGRFANKSHRFISKDDPRLVRCV